MGVLEITYVEVQGIARNHLGLKVSKFLNEKKMLTFTWFEISGKLHTWKIRPVGGEENGWSVCVTSRRSYVGMAKG